MTNSIALGHCATALVKVTPSVAFDFLSDPNALGKWSLGCMQARPTNEQGLFTGFSLFDDSQVWFRIESCREKLLVDYLVGTPDQLKSRISVRIVPPETCNLMEGHCYISLIGWRSSTMTEERWLRLCAAHDVEISLIKSRLEGPEAVEDLCI